MCLGQHFLTNKNKLKKFIDALELKNKDVVIEIGAGHGEITENIKYQISNIKIIAIEKDASLVKFLKEKFSGDKNVEIIQGDVLKILSRITNDSKLATYNYKLTGNIPFYITGRLLRTISELKIKPEAVVLIIQKEVAERICAVPPEMNLFAASVGFWAKPKIIGYISKKDFKPEPKVDSAIIKLVIKQLSNYVITQLPNYYRFIKILFKQPRKTILNNLTYTDLHGLEHELTQINKEKIIEKLHKLGIKPSDRPQNLTIEQIKKIISGNEN